MRYKASDLSREPNYTSEGLKAILEPASGLSVDLALLCNPETPETALSALILRLYLILLTQASRRKGSRPFLPLLIHTLLYLLTLARDFIAAIYPLFDKPLMGAAQRPARADHAPIRLLYAQSLLYVHSNQAGGALGP